MDGFVPDVPLQVAVSWLKNADGSYQEAPLLDGTAYPFGLLAFTQDGSTITRWFVPWSSVVYIKQGQPAPMAAQAPQTSAPTQPGGPVGDGA